MRLLLAFLMFLGFLSAQVAGQAISDRINEVLTRPAYTINAGGVAVGIIDPSGNITLGGNGFATIGLETTRHDSILFGMSDISKHIMAVLTLKLVENGEISLSDQLGTGITPPQANPANYPSSVTIEQLLKHETGINNFADAQAFMDVNSFTFVDPSQNYGRPTVNYALTYAQLVDPQGPPGSAGSFEYSSTNYLLLGKKLELETGKSLQQLIDEIILTPLSANVDFNPSIVFWPSDDSTVVDQSATFYYTLTTSPVALSDQTAVLTTTGAAGGMVSSPKTLLAYLQNLFAGNILNQSSLNLLQSFQNISGRLSDAYSYGTEQFTFNINGQSETYIGHSGNLNYRSIMAYSPSSNYGVVCLDNTFTRNDTLMFELAQDLLTELDIALDNEDVLGDEPFARLYPNPSSGQLNLSLDVKNPGKLNLVVYDIRGARVYGEEFTLNQIGEGKLSLDLGDLLPGSYFVRLQMGEQFRTLKWLKN